MRLFFLLVAGALALPMCNPLPPPAPPTPVDASDASPGPAPVPEAAPPVPPELDARPGPLDACRKSYDHLVGIHCTPEQPSAGTWLDVCRNGRQHGTFRLDGIDRATTPDEAKRAGVNCAAAR